eukprot:TRINITY_DN2212_c0_g1_i1.p1 TRINITY_DN2212_c0_g1~~TRINITY_DN2212_c0_g1_i1.p1  ORF type:complete len:105 (+),score=5.41 TRINITY_DN2212_c0_g1_i1:158-472(+)
MKPLNVSGWALVSYNPNYTEPDNDTSIFYALDGNRKYFEQFGVIIGDFQIGRLYVVMIEKGILHSTTTISGICASSLVDKGSENCRVDNECTGAGMCDIHRLCF